jgi:hypothetical protein
MVSMVKKKAKIKKKLSFSMLIFVFLESNIGDNKTKETAILAQVSSRKVLPTLSILFFLTIVSIKTITTEQVKKNP